MKLFRWNSSLIFEDKFVLTIFISTENLILCEAIKMEFSFDFWTQICFDVDFFSDVYVSFFFWFFGGPISFRGFLMPHEFHLCWWVFSLEILWPTDHFFIIFQVFFFHSVVRVGSAQWFAFVVVGEKWKSLCIVYCRLKIWTHPPRLGRSGRNFRSCLRYFG